MVESVKKKAILSTLWQKSTDVLTVLVVWIAVALVTFRLCGFNFYTVMSGSMEPSLGVGSIVFVKSVDVSKLESGDIISYVTAGNNIVTHRVNEVIASTTDDSLSFVTKGDANNTVDSKPVDYRNVIGRVAFSVPKLGFLAHSLQRPPISNIMLFIGALLLGVAFVPSVEKNERRKTLTG